MAKFIIILFLSMSLGVGYLTYNGVAQEKVETTKKEQRVNVRSNSYRGSSSNSYSSSYNSSSYNYGK